MAGGIAEQWKLLPVVVPVEEVGFKERVKNDIVLVEATPEFKPTAVKRDFEDEGRLREERERQAQEEENLRREKTILLERMVFRFYIVLPLKWIRKWRIWSKSITFRQKNSFIH